MIEFSGRVGCVIRSPSRTKQMRRFLLLLLFMICLPACQTNKPNRPPDLGGMLIGEAFHHCAKCNSMIGGIHAKGPTKSLDGEGCAECVHNWMEIDSETFRTRATEIHGIDWSAEDAFYWNRRQ